MYVYFNEWNVCMYVCMYVYLVYVCVYVYFDEWCKYCYVCAIHTSYLYVTENSIYRRVHK